jgi:hypothetical protein
MPDYLMLSDLIGRADFLELLCGRCERSGRLSVARLAREYPPDTCVTWSMCTIQRSR